MATHATQPSGRKTLKSKSKVLGRSAVTGKFVLSPASKAGRISMREANKAVKHTLDKRH